MASAIIILSALVPVMTEVTSGEDEALHVFVIAGQSNAADYVSDVTLANEMPSIPQGKAYYYGTDDRPMYYGNHKTTPTYDSTFESYDIYDIVDDDGKYVIGGLETPFASKFVNLTEDRILLINTAIGGQSIENMLPGESGNTYAQNVFTHAIADVPEDETIVYEAILFIQGETDSSMDVDEYISDFESMAASFMDFTNCDEILISKVRAENGVNTSVAQIQLCEDSSEYIMGSTASDEFTIANGLLSSDGLHYTQLGKNIIGAQLAQTYVDLHPDLKAPYSSLWSATITMTIIGTVAGGIFYIARSAKAD